MLATLGDFIHTDHYHSWTLPMNGAPQSQCGPMKKSRFGDWRTPKGLPSASDPETEADRTPRGSLLACMTASCEPSNQSFEVDREATVCYASRRFFLIIPLRLVSAKHPRAPRASIRFGTLERAREEVGGGSCPTTRVISLVSPRPTSAPSPLRLVPRIQPPPSLRPLACGAQEQRCLSSTAPFSSWS